MKIRQSIRYALVGVLMLLTLFYSKNLVQADDNIGSGESALYLAVKSENPTLTENSYVSDGYQITELVNEDGTVKASEVYNPETSEYLSSTSDGVTATTETAVLNDGVLDIQRETFNIQVSEDVAISKSGRGILRAAPSWMYGPWTYTGVAIPNAVVNSLVGWAFTGGVSYIAGIYGIGTEAVSKAFKFMGVSSFYSGVAGALDTNGNGYVGIYRRAVYSSPNVFSGNQFRTY